MSAVRIGAVFQNRPVLAKMIRSANNAEPVNSTEETVMAREWVWLQCTESGDLNYRISINPKEYDTKKMVAKFCPKLRKHTEHKVKKGK
jgi:large subunit ribosomal protein L33